MTDAERLPGISARHVPSFVGERPEEDQFAFCIGCTGDNDRATPWPCDTAVALAEVERLRGVIGEMEAQRVLRDQSVIVGQDGAVFEQIAKWAKAPTNTASADLSAPRGEG